MRISDWSSEGCSSDLIQGADVLVIGGEHPAIKKTLRLVIGMIGGVLGAGIKGSCGHVVLPRSNSGGRQRAATEAVRAAASASVFCAISQASNSDRKSVV